MPSDPEGLTEGRPEVYFLGQGQLWRFELALSAWVYHSYY